MQKNKTKVERKGVLQRALEYTVKIGNKELIGIKEPFPVTNLPFISEG